MDKLKILIIIILCSLCFAEEEPYLILNSFNAGELSELLSAREDLSKYQSGCSYLENFIVLPQGAIEKRTGTEYIAEIKDSNFPVRLIPFEYADTDTYITEWGSEYVRFYHNGGQVLTGTGTETLILSDAVSQWFLNDNESSSTVLDNEELVNGFLASSYTTETRLIHDDDGVNGCFDMKGSYLVLVADNDAYSFTTGSNDTSFSVTGWFFVTDSEEPQVLVSKWHENTDQEYKLWMDEDRKLTLTLSESVADLSGNCISQWKLNETSGTTVTDSQGIQNGVASTNTSNLMAEGATAKTGTSFDLDNQYYVNVADHASHTFGTGLADSAFSLAAWIYYTSSWSSNDIMSKWDATTGAEKREWRFYAYNEYLKLYIADESANAIQGRTANDKLSDGWHFVVGTYSGVGGDDAAAGIKLYVDGEEVSYAADYDSGTYVAMENMTTPVKIGASQDTGAVTYNWDDKIDNTMIFNKTLSVGEVLALYQGGEGTESLVLGDTTYAKTNNAIDTGWHFIAVTYGGTGGVTAADNITFFVDGNEVASTAYNNAAYTSMQNTTTEVRLGGQKSISGLGEYYWQDKLDNIAIYNDALSAGEVASLASEVPYEIETPYKSNDLRYIKYIQSADVMFFVHPDYAPRKLSRYNHLWWEMEIVDFSNGPFLDENTDDDIYITSPSPSADITSTAYVISSGDYSSYYDDLAFDNAKAAITDAWMDNDISDLYIGQNFVTAKLVKRVRIYPCISTTYKTRCINHFKIQASDNGTDWVDIPIEKWIGRVEGYNEDEAHGGLAQAYAEYIDLYLDNNEDYIYWRVFITDNWGDATYTGILEIEMFEEQSDIYTSNSDIWNEQMEGSLWQLSYKVNQSAVSGSFANGTNDNFSASLQVKGDWVFTTSNTWTGTIKIQKSYDYGKSWDDFRPFSSQVTSSGEEVLDNVWYRVFCDVVDSGTMGYNLSVQNPNIDGIIRIDNVISPNEITATVISELAYGSDGNNTWHWSESAWSDYRGWPRAITFFEDRLMLAGTTYKPQSLWGSQTGDYTNMMAGVEDSDALKFTLSSGQINDILWLTPKDKIVIGTMGGEWTLSGSNDEPLTPSNVKASLQSTYGSADLQALLVNESVLFFQKNTKKLRELAFNWELDSYVAPDMTIMNPEITGTGIVDMAYQQTPNAILWCIKEDGEIAAFSYERKQEITAWSRHITDGDFESIASISSSGEDEVWVEAERDVNNVTKRYIERFAARELDDINDAFYVDCGRTYTTDVNVISDLYWLDGLDVFVLADGDVLEVNSVTHELFTVTNGTVTLGGVYDTVQIGLPYTAQMQTMRLSWLGENMTIQSRIKRIHEAIARYYNSGDFYLGRDSTHLEYVSVDRMDTSEKRLSFPLGYDRLGKCLIYQYSPQPLTLIALMLEFVVY